MRKLWLIITLMILVTTFTSAQAQATCSTNRCIYLPLVIKGDILNTTPPLIQGDVGVRSVRVFRSTYGSSLYIAGEILNTTSLPIYFTKIAARFYDSSGTLVATEDTYTYLTATFPSQRNPFKIILSNPPANMATFNLSLTYSNNGLLDYQPISILSQQTRDNSGIEVFGEVKNTQTREMRSIEVAVTFYDSMNNVLDVDFGFPSATTLAPDATSPYSIKTFEQALQFNTLVVQGQGYVAP